MNKQMSTETKYPCFKGLINILEESEKIDFNEMGKTQVETFFEWPSVLRDFFEFYAICYEGLSFQAFLHKGILQYLESIVDLNLSDAQFGAALSKIIQHTLEEEIRPYFGNDQSDKNTDQIPVEVIRISNDEKELNIVLNDLNPDMEKLEVAEMGLVIEVNPKETVGAKGSDSILPKGSILHKIIKHVESKEDTDSIAGLLNVFSDEQKEIIKSLKE